MSAVSTLAGAQPRGAAFDAALAADCFHCGLPVPADGNWRVTIDQVAQPMCCPGCQAVAQTIVDNGLGDYYRNRTSFAAGADQSGLIPPELRLYDEPEALKQFAASDDAEVCEALLSVEGIRCAACVWLIEARLARLPGVSSAHMNVATERLQLRWRAAECKPSTILRTLRELGYTAYPYDAARQGEHLRKSAKTLFRQLFIAGLSMMQVMMYAFPAYVTQDGLEADMAGLMRWASLLLTLPAVVYSAQPFFAGAWKSLRGRALGMNVPVALGIAAAFIGSTVATWTGEGEVYFDSVTMFIFLLLGSRYVELMARRKAATALERLQHAWPASATRLAGFPANSVGETVAAAALQAGDFIRIRPGETIAADGFVVEGESAVDLSLLSGESEPQHKTVGDVLPGGALNVSQAIVMQVSRPLADSTLSALIKLVERAGCGKPQIAQWADRVAAWFVAALLMFAVAVFAYWSWADAARAWPIAIAVLVVSCPCALSLATPSALAAATDNLVRQGVLIVQPHVLETLHRATHVVFDKTGTLTLGRPTLRQIKNFSEVDAGWLLQIAAALESGSAHPLGQGLLAAAADKANASEPLAMQQIVHSAGQGLEGSLNGVRYRLGRADFVAELADTAAPEAADSGLTPVHLAREGQWLARFDLADALRPEAQAVVDHFKAVGQKVLLLSGDQQAITRRVADELGIERAVGECLPQQKLECVQQLQAEGAVVAMVGDGINDAAVIRAADVSFAMGAGAALAQAHADAVLLSGRLDSMRDAAVMADRTMAVIRQNLYWSTLYNLTAIPAAALGWLNPWLAGVGMALSSALVVANALRLRRVERGGASHMTGSPQARRPAAPLPSA